MFRRYLEQGSAAVLQGAVLERADDVHAQMEAIRALATLAGYEDWPIYVSYRTAPESAAGTGDETAKRLISTLASGAVEVAFPLETVLRGELREPAVCLSGLTHRYVASRYRERMNAGAHVESILFRDGGRWLLALWSANGAREASLDLTEATDLKWTDVLNNPLDLPDGEKGALRLPVDERVRLLSGSGGVFLGRAALTRTQFLTKQFTGNEAFNTHLPAALMEIVGLFAQQAGGASSRPNFLAMVRSFPSLERDWHEGALPESVAVPAIAQLARIAREICTVEQQSGLPFLDPLQDTLARCNEYQSLYLTSSAGTGATCERGDWILDETRRLVEEAQKLADADRRIEAAAVATLAEWRARSLEFAALAKPPKPLASETVTPPTVIEPPAGNDKDSPPAAETRRTHRAARKDTPGGIAQKYGISLDDFRKWNSLAKNGRLKEGKDYFIAPAPDAPAKPEATPTPPVVEPPKAETPPPAAEKPAPAEEKPQKPEPEKTETPPVAEKPAEPVAKDSGKAKTHTIAPGDNPSSIADKYKIKLEDFLKWNKLTPKARFQIGQVYVVEAPGAEAAAEPEKPVEKEKAKEEPKPEPAKEPAKEEPKEPKKEEPKKEEAKPSSAKKHTVQKGDIPASIAKKYGISTDDFFKWNKLTATTPLRIGQEYSVAGPESKDAGDKKAEKAPAKPANAKEAARTPGSHTAKADDTAQSIAKQYGISLQDFYRWNHFQRGQSVKAGQKYDVAGER